MAFVRSLIIFMTYELAAHRALPPRMTMHQLGNLVQERDGLKLAGVQLDRLFRKYITRPGRPATRLELARQTFKGRPGIPSEYELSGLLQLIGAESGLQAA
jgi:hypothetical protein